MLIASPFVFMKWTRDLTDSQKKRLRSAIKRQHYIPKDIRLKIYIYVKNNLKIGMGLFDVISDYISWQLDEDVTSNQWENILLECKKDTYMTIMDSSDDVYWDSLDRAGYERRIEFLNHIIERM